jgi:hypothetical protein
MTNYDRWKLATPDYLEDTDGDAPIGYDHAEMEQPVQDARGTTTCCPLVQEERRAGKESHV